MKIERTKCKYCHTAVYVKELDYIAIGTKVFKYKRITRNFCPVCGKKLKEN